MKKFIYSMILMVVLAVILKMPVFTANAADMSIDMGVSYDGELTNDNKENYYEFTLTESGRVRVNVTTTMRNIYYYIYDSSDVRVWGATYSNGVDQNVDLVEGTYYLYVGKGYGDTGNYNFKLSFVSANESFHESIGNTKNSMNDAPAISFGESYNGQLAVNDTIDYYEFSLTESGRVRVNVTTTMRNIRYYIYNSSAVSVWGATYSNGVDQNVDLVEGIYYFYVDKNYGDTGNYNFKLSFVSANESFNESVGNTKNSMDDAPAISFGKSYNGQLAINDTIDYYEFTIPESGKVHVNVTTTMRNIRYYIYNSSAVSVWGATYSNGVDKEVDLVEGTYYFYVDKNYGDTGNYSFSISGDMDTYNQNTDDWNMNDWNLDNHECIGTWITTIDATCTQNGRIEYICDICAKTIEVQLIPATGHSYSEWIVNREATCNAEGSRYSFCIFCGTEVNENIPKLEHTMTGWSVTKQPTCYSVGTQTRMCTKCGSTETQELSALAHEFGKWSVVKNASCDQVGSEERVCSLCGSKESRGIAALEHKYGEWKVVTPATCNQPGVEERACSLCNKKESREIPASTAHTYGEWKVVTPAACGQAGKEEGVCSLCGKKQSREIAAIEHKYGEWKVVTPASCNQTGTEEGVCSLCGKKQSREIAALKHTYGEWEIVTPAKCDQIGKEERVCSLCGDKESKEISASSEHQYGNWRTVIPAKCNQTGINERVCTLCGNIETQTVEILAHKYDEYEIISGSKLIPPIVKEKKCSLCGNLERVNDWSYVWVTILVGILAGILAVGATLGVVTVIKEYVHAFRK